MASPGAGNGIGRATAIASVIVSDIDERAGLETVARISESGSKALFVRCDVSDPQDVDVMFDRAIESLGAIHHAVNNSGVDSGMEPELRGNIEEFRRLYAVNVFGVFTCMRREIPHMKKLGGGAIVNLASLAGHMGVPSKPIYLGTKYAVLGMTRTAGLQYVRYNIRVNELCPGSVRTNMLEPSIDLIPGGEATLRAATPCKRIAEPEEMAAAMLYLSSESARFVIGQGLAIDGGLSAGIAPWS